MKLYALYSPSHEALYREWFLPSMRDDFELVVRQTPQVVPAGRFRAAGWAEAMQAKVRLILEASAQGDPRPFVHSDVDVQFFAPVRPALEAALADYDIVFQRDDPRGTVCCGFFAARPGPKVTALFSHVLSELTRQARFHDQEIVNHVLIDRAAVPASVMRAVRASWRLGVRAFPYFPRIANQFGLRWNYLPAAFQSGGTLSGRRWKPGDAFRLAEGVLLHHANWTEGVDAKVAQLELVKKLQQAARG